MPTTCSLASAIAIAWRSSCIVRSVSAFSLSGRLSVIVATGSSI
jgi:hypothetical protein